MYGNFLLIYLNWREICPLRMPKDLLCFLPNRGFVLKDTVCWPLPQDSKSRVGLYLDDKWYIVDLCHWPAIFLFLLAGLICSGGMRQQLSLHTVLYRGILVVVCDNLFLEVMILAIKSCKIICCLFFFTLQFGLNRAEICPSLASFEFWLFGSDLERFHVQRIFSIR